MSDDVRQSWEEFLNPDRMRTNLIKASIYIAAYESLKDAIISRVKEMYWTGWNKDEGDIVDPKYDFEVLSLNKSVLYASFEWLRKNGAVTFADLSVLDRVKTCRNHLAHRLLFFLSKEGMPPNFEICFGEMVELLEKIEKWWIINIELPLNPDMSSSEADINGIIPGRVIVIQLMCDIALGSEKNSKFYYEEFKKLSKRMEN